MSDLQFPALERVLLGVKSMMRLDATALMVTWCNIIEEDNRMGILAGLDKDGVPMAPVTYRPKAPGPYRVSKTKTKDKRLKESLKQFRVGQRPNLTRGAFAGIGPAVSGLNNNLSTAEYQLLGGPPLAPRDQFSRVITNMKFKVEQPNGDDGQWAALGAWDEVVSTKGQPFLHYHFDGIGQKRRDLRGVRPQGIAKALDALRNWARLAVREHFGR